MSSTSKNSSKGGRGSQQPSGKGAGSGSSDVGNARKDAGNYSIPSKDVSKTDKVPSKGPDGKTVFKPKDLTICWQEESQFWIIPKRDDGPAELLKVCWLDVSGEMPVTKGKAYEVSFMLSMNTENSFGWDGPVTVMARIGKEGKYERKEICLSDLKKDQVEERPQEKCRVEFESDEKSESKEEPREKKSQTKSKKSESKEEPREKKSQAKSKSDENAKNDKETLYFGLYEVWTNKWKGGLRIHEAIVQEIPAGNNASTSNTRSGESRGKEIAAHENPRSSRSSRSRS